MRNLRGGTTKACASRFDHGCSARIPPADISLMDSVPGITYADQRVTLSRRTEANVSRTQKARGRGAWRVHEVAHGRAPLASAGRGNSHRL